MLSAGRTCENAWAREVCPHQQQWLAVRCALPDAEQARLGRWLERRPLNVSKRREAMLAALGDAASEPLRASGTVPCLLWRGPKKVRVTWRRQCEGGVEETKTVKHFRRLVYEASRGPIPKGWVCVALCENSAPGGGRENLCVDPRHLTCRAKPPPGVSALDDAIGDAAEHAVRMHMMLAHASVKRKGAEVGGENTGGVLKKQKRTIQTGEESEKLICY